MQRAAEVAVLDDPAQRFVADLAMIVMQEKRRRIVGDAYFADRLGLAGDRRPYADPVEHPHRTVGNGAGTAVEPIGQHGRRVVPVDHRDLEPGRGAGNAQRQPVEAAAHHSQLDPR